MAGKPQLTPLMEQYVNVKNQHPDEVVFFRVGDFYEMFNADAVEVSRLLNLTLTHRGESPMCGVPYHASRVYIARRLRLGKKIAICEQVGEIAPAGGLTERKVVEIITPGTAVEDEYLERGSNNFLASLSISRKKAGFAYIDVTTADFYATSWPASEMGDNFAKELGRANPRELVLPLSLKENEVIQQALQEIPGISVSYYPDWHFNAENSYKKLLSQFKTVNLDSFSLTESSAEIPPAGFLLDYLEKTTNAGIPHVSKITVYHDSQFVILDESSRRNLEVVQNLRDGSSQFTLLDCVNHTLTAMGNRTIRSWLLSPLTDINAINERQRHITAFADNEVLLKKVREYLVPVLDIERLAGRIAMERAHAKDLIALKVSLSSWLAVQAELRNAGFSLPESGDSSFIINLIDQSICDDPSTLFTEGRLIKQGWSSELDHYKDVQNNFSKILDEYLEEERRNTGILNLKIKHNSAAGYFLEVTKGKLSAVPPHFIIRRSLLNSERYTTERLQELEKELNHASGNIIETERSLFMEIRSRLNEYVPFLMEQAREIAYFDVAASLAHAAVINRWVRPEISDDTYIRIDAGRHPVVEKHLPSGEFVPNDMELDSNDSETSGSSFLLITGPNMAGKSTYLRQNALIALLAQTGSYVPAKYAHIGIVDKIFCRVGASDNLARGESTFLVEMTETARILRSATRKSLVIMDEVGRGTSTEDGLSIAWAVSEYLLDKICCRTLFATHYHELTRLSHEKVRFMCMDVCETGGAVVFLRKIKDGAAENSYGIHVAKLAGVPDSVIGRANEIIMHIQSMAAENPLGNDISVQKQVSATPVQESKPSFTVPGLFSDEEIILDEILSCDTDNMTPMAALQAITRWKKELSGK